MIHGDLEPRAPAGTFTQSQLDSFRAQEIEVEDDGGEVVLVTPLNVAFGNPDLLAGIGVSPVVVGLANETQYRNDEMIDNQLRSVLFEVPVTGNPECPDGPTLPECFRGVVDLGAIDIERGRDHGMKKITGESTESFPNDPEIDQYDPINDPDILDFIVVNGQRVRRTTVAARLKAIYGNVNKVDAF